MAAFLSSVLPCDSQYFASLLLLSARHRRRCRPHPPIPLPLAICPFFPLHASTSFYFHANFLSANPNFLCPWFSLFKHPPNDYYDGPWRCCACIFSRKANLAARGSTVLLLPRRADPPSRWPAPPARLKAFAASLRLTPFPGPAA